MDRHALRHAAGRRSPGFFEKDRKSTRLNSSHGYISYAVFCLKKKETYRDKSNEEPNRSYAAPVEREKNRAWRNNQGNDQRDRDCKITGLTFHRRDMKRRCQD